VFVRDVICFTIFSRELIPEEIGFEIYYTNLPMIIIKSLPSYIACHDSSDPLFQSLEIWIQGSGAAGHVSSTTYFSNLLENKDRKFKIKLTLSLILRVNLRLGDYSIWSASLIAPHIKKTGQLLEVRAPHSLDAAKEVLRGHLQDEVQENSKTPSEVLGRLQNSPTKSLGLVRPGHIGLLTWHTPPRIRDGT
jgi:hypothetical protein